jgi:hypothetical protein
MNRSELTATLDLGLRFAVLAFLFIGGIIALLLPC